jgi:hypothetical protein
VVYSILFTDKPLCAGHHARNLDKISQTRDSKATLEAKIEWREAKGRQKRKGRQV